MFYFQAWWVSGISHNDVYFQRVIDTRIVAVLPPLLRTLFPTLAVRNSLFLLAAVLLSSKTDLIICQITEWFVETEVRNKQNYLVKQTPNTLALKENIYIGHIGQEFWSKLILLGWSSEVKLESCCLQMTTEICPSTKHKNNFFSQTWF